MQKLDVQHQLPRTEGNHIHDWQELQQVGPLIYFECDTCGLKVSVNKKVDLPRY